MIHEGDHVVHRRPLDIFGDALLELDLDKGEAVGRSDQIARSRWKCPDDPVDFCPGGRKGPPIGTFEDLDNTLGPLDMLLLPDIGLQGIKIRHYCGIQRITGLYDEDDGRIGLEMFDIICIHDSLFRRLIQVGLPPALHGDLGHAEDGDTEQGCDQPCYEERFPVD